jgi:hypothetical protein
MSFAPIGVDQLCDLGEMDAEHHLMPSDDKHERAKSLPPLILIIDHTNTDLAQMYLSYLPLLNATTCDTEGN